MANGPRTIRFGVFEADLAAGELRRNGGKVKLQEQPFQVLAALLEKPGDVVSKEELQERIWKDDTFVDFDRSLATAVNKVRHALGDSASRPRFVETVPKRGYRFVGGAGYPSEDLGASAPSASSTPAAWRRRGGAVALLIAALVCAIVVARMADDSSDAAVPVAAPLTSDPGYELWPTFSPDGAYVAFAASDPFGKAFDVLSLHLDSGERLRITSSPQSEYAPAWSPDGRSIGFLRDFEDGTFGVYVTSPLGGRERLLNRVAATTARLFAELHPALAWTHDSKHLVASDRDSGEAVYRLVRISADTGEKTPIQGLPPNGDGSFSPALSADGGGIAFVSERTGGLRWGRLIDGGRAVSDIRDLTAANLWVSNPSFLIDSLVFSAGDKFCRRLWQVGVGGGSPRLIGGPADSSYHPAVSPSGDRLVYSQSANDFNVWRLDLDETGALTGRSPIALSTRYEGNATFSPNGESIAFESNRSGSAEVWTCNLLESECAPVTSFHAYSGSPRWSPDGTKIAFDSNVNGSWSVYVVDADGGHARPVLQGQEHAVGPDFSADGKWIYYFSQGTGEGDIWRVPAEGGRPTRVTHVGANRPRMARDGEWMYFATPKGVFRAPVEGGKEELALSPAPPGMKWAVARDGLYFLSEESGRVEIRFKRFNEGKSTLAGVIDTPLYPFLEISADGKSLLVTQIDRQGSDLMIINDFR